MEFHGIPRKHGNSAATAKFRKSVLLLKLGHAVPSDNYAGLLISVTPFHVQFAYLLKFLLTGPFDIMWRLRGRFCSLLSSELTVVVKKRKKLIPIYCIFMQQKTRAMLPFIIENYKYTNRPKSAQQCTLKWAAVVSRGIPRICRGEPRNLANGAMEFVKICRGKLWTVVITGVYPAKGRPGSGTTKLDPVTQKRLKRSRIEGYGLCPQACMPLAHAAVVPPPSM